MVGALRAQDVPTKDLFTGEGHAPEALAPEEEAAGGPPQTVAEQADLPDWLWDAFCEDLGEVAFEQAQALRDRAPVTLRVNEKMSNAAQAAEILSKEGIVTSPSASHDTALLVTDGARRIRNSGPYLEGLVELQDASSQAAMARVPVTEGDNVLDLCAGGGGKTLALAARVSANWHAYDANPDRMADVPERATRAGVSVKTLSKEELEPHGPYDVVLCDVPCSGSGTWRRTPDAKWRLSTDDLVRLMSLQQEILAHATTLVAPQGQIVYCTCSVLNRENEDQITGFLARNPDRQLQDEMRWPISSQGDGFYYACLSAAL